MSTEQNAWIRADEEAERRRYERVRSMSPREKLEALEHRGRLLAVIRERAKARQAKTIVSKVSGEGEV